MTNHFIVKNIITNFILLEFLCHYYTVKITLCARKTRTKISWQIHFCNSVCILVTYFNCIHILLRFTHSLLSKYEKIWRWLYTNYVSLLLLLLFTCIPTHFLYAFCMLTADRGKCQGLRCSVRSGVCVFTSFTGGACVCEKPFWFFRNFARLLAPPTSAHAQLFGYSGQWTGQQQFRGSNEQCVSRRAHRVTTYYSGRPDNIFEHDENVRSPMALGRILSDPDLRVSHSNVGIPQPRRKGNILGLFFYFRKYFNWIYM